jgi:ABC-type bacteriocin/lantibiotic exporter with double-glycine peptidase domain
MKHRTSIRAFVILAIAALCVLALAEPTYAQCVMCRASLGNNSSFLRNFNIGVLVLLVPPVSIFCTIFVIAIRHRRSG